MISVVMPNRTRIKPTAASRFIMVVVLFLCVWWVDGSILWGRAEDGVGGDGGFAA
jgi:hypothetical protein